MEPAILLARYRIEHRDPDQATLVVGYADKEVVATARLLLARNRLLRAEARGTVVLVDQETDTVVASRPLQWHG